MKIFSVCGITKSGKTTTIEGIIAELVRRGYRVGSVKEIHNEGFQIDPNPASNTRRHRAAGASLVCARGLFETDFLYPEKLDMDKILSHYEGEYDFVVLEGVNDIPVPTIVTAHGLEDLREKWSDMVFAVSGRIAHVKDSLKGTPYSGTPAISALEDIQKLVDLVELNVYERLPNFSPKCCTACGCTCATLGSAILRGEKKRGDCVADRGVQLKIGGKTIKLVPFVQDILRGTVLGVVRELEGYKAGEEIEITF
ncbi:MAG: molybdopterin-guanine dinucleotide biosynthesis protein MobB [Oscillospiraceae bacterium]|nr:molybdopterin-guanine dinucleotide biosynthesis protein MobB [Oscillospiraceae bacterium]